MATPPKYDEEYQGAPDMSGNTPDKQTLPDQAGLRGVPLNPNMVAQGIRNRATAEDITAIMESPATMADPLIAEAARVRATELGLLHEAQSQAPTPENVDNLPETGGFVDGAVMTVDPAVDQMLKEDMAAGGDAASPSSPASPNNPFDLVDEWTGDAKLKDSVAIDMAPDEQAIAAEVVDMDPSEDAYRDYSEAAQVGMSANMALLVRGLGAPVDLINAGLGAVGLGTDRPLGGSDSLQSGLSSIGMVPKVGEKMRDTAWTSAGNMLGSSAAVLLPFGVMTKGLSALNQPFTTLGGAAWEIAKRMTTRPGRFLASETASAIGAGVGGYEARQMFPGSDIAQFAGEILGGLTPTVAFSGAKILGPPAASLATGVPFLGKIGSIGAGYIRLKISGIKTGILAQQRAEERMQSVAEYPGKAISEMEALRAEGGAAEKLSLPQLTGDQGLMELEKSVIESSSRLKVGYDNQIDEAVQAIKKDIGSIGDGVSIDVTQDVIESARNHLRGLLDARVKIAGRLAEERVAVLGPSVSRQEANIIFKEELEAAELASSENVRQIWAAVPKGIARPTDNISAEYAAMLSETPLAQRHHVPEVARRLLDPNSKSFLGKTAKETETTVIDDITLTPEESAIFRKLSGSDDVADDGLKTGEAVVGELQGVRSELLEIARAARGEKRFTAERLALRMARAVERDLGAVADDIQGEAGALLRIALDASKLHHNKFTKGTVGAILGTNRMGAESVPASIVLETILGAGGPKSLQRMGKAYDAADTPKMRDAVKDFLLDEYSRKVAKDGQIIRAKHNQFMMKYKDVLGEMTELRSQLQDASWANDASMAASQRADGVARALNDPRVSKAAIFVNSDIEEAVSSVFSHKNPSGVMGELVKQASRDTTGDAVRGLKTGVMDYLYQKSKLQQTTISGEHIISGQKMRDMLKDPKISKALNAILSKEERRRVEVISMLALRVEQSVKAPTAAGGIVADTPALMIEALAKIVGGSVGRAMKTGTLQAPQMMAKIFGKMAGQMIHEPTEKLIIESIHDEDLFKALLEDTTKSVAKAADVERKLNAWLVSLAAGQDSGDTE